MPVQTEPNFTPGTSEVLFEGDYFVAGGRSYDVAPDGMRFLMIKEGGEDEDTSAPSQIILVQNWFEAAAGADPVTTFAAGRDRRITEW